MPGTRRAYLNDNVRTEHLKCAGCRTQVYLAKIEPDGDGGEIRTFGCPHCSVCRSIRLAPQRYRNKLVGLVPGTEGLTVDGGR